MKSNILNSISSIKGKPWLFFYIASFLNIAVFISFLLLLHPLWVSINEGLVRMISLSLPWLFIIILLVTIFSGYLFFIIFKFIKSHVEKKEYRLHFFGKIFPFPMLIIWNILFYMLIDGVREEIVMAHREFLIVLPWFILMVVVFAILFIIPFSKKLWNMKGKVVLFILFFIGIVVYNYDFSSHQIIAGPYLQRVTEHEATISWVTNRKAVSWIEYGEEDAMKKVESSTDGLLDLNRIHRITLKNLIPGKKYQYKVVVKPLKSYYAYYIEYGDLYSTAVKKFVTNDRNAESVSFLVFNDIHEQVSLINDFIVKFNDKNFDFVFINGDFFNHIYSEKQVVDNFLNPVSSLLDGRIPFYLIRGNHEARGRFALKLKDYINCGDCGYYYAFTHGPVRFIVLDCGEDKPDSFKEYGELGRFDLYREKERVWLEKEIRSPEFKKARYRIVLTHMPPFVPQKEDEEHGVQEAAEKFAPLLKKGKVDLLIAGHLHRTKILEPDKDHPYPIIIGGGRWVKNTMVHVKVTGKKIEAELIDEDGTVFNRLEL